MVTRKVESQTPAIKAKTKSGWCLSKDHKNCPNNFTFIECSCECHSGTPAKRKYTKRKIK